MRGLSNFIVKAQVVFDHFDILDLPVKAGELGSNDSVERAAFYFIIAIRSCSPTAISI